MKKIFFVIFTVISITSYTISGLLLAINLTDENPGMVMIFLVPFLIIGVASGIIALLIKQIKSLELKQFLTWLHYLNLILIPLSIIALIYVFKN